MEKSSIIGTAAVIIGALMTLVSFHLSSCATLISMP